MTLSSETSMRKNTIPSILYGSSPKTLSIIHQIINSGPAPFSVAPSSMTGTRYQLRFAASLKESGKIEMYFGFDTAHVAARGVGADINFNLNDYGDDLENVHSLFDELIQRASECVLSSSGTSVAALRKANNYLSFDWLAGILSSWMGSLVYT